MPGRFARVTVLLVTVTLVGCGGGSTSHPGSSASVASRTAASSTTAAGAATRSAERKRHSRTSSVSSASAAGAGTPRASTSGTTRSAPPPTPAGTPSAPPGLAPSIGYGTYELCAGTCSGSVPPSIRRPLHLPTGSGGACPVSAGSGPVRASPSQRLATEHFIGSAWLGARVTWTAAPGYKGPVLIRGRRLGGPGVVGFGEGHAPYDELQLLDAGQGAPAAPKGGRAWLTFMRVRAAGCYADQIDGTSFSSVAVFKVEG
ncbi:MAG: hypothetical protein ACR2MK_08120 [Solirubrobacteraceae bacterium]